MSNEINIQTITLKKMSAESVLFKRISAIDFDAIGAGRSREKLNILGVDCYIWSVEVSYGDSVSIDRCVVEKSQDRHTFGGRLFDVTLQVIECD